MHKFRTHKCHELTIHDIGLKVKLSGWIHSKRDHGGLIFIDLRDSKGITQCVIDQDSKLFSIVGKLRIESVITVVGEVIKRDIENINTDISTGEIEVVVSTVIVENEATVLPFLIAEDDNAPEELRLKYRFLDLRKPVQHDKIVLRSQVIAFLRQKMQELQFLEIQTPILTASSPEGARDFLVPSRKHPGKFYALPQAPQIFKQLLMVSGFEKYFQIAPCFRDEDARADRTPGEFYQLDFEMAFCTQDEVLTCLKEVMLAVFNKFAPANAVVNQEFITLAYQDSMRLYATDKPDLRNPLFLVDTTEVFQGSDFSLFANLIHKGAVVRGIKTHNTANQPRSFFDKLNDWAKVQGQGGLGYIIYDHKGEYKGPIASKLSDDRLALLKDLLHLQLGDSVFFICGNLNATNTFASQTRDKLANELNLIDCNRFEFCFINDYPMYEIDTESLKIDFSHNPFSMPQGGIEALETQDPLEILAYQYDLVCNGIELSSGAIRNHNPKTMLKAFEIAGYTEDDIRDKFAGLFNAFHYGAPPHGGAAPGIDRLIMLLTGSENIREIIAFPLTQTGEDLLMRAPSQVQTKQLNELHIQPKKLLNR